MEEQQAPTATGDGGERSSGWGAELPDALVASVDRYIRDVFGDRLGAASGIDPDDALLRLALGELSDLRARLVPEASIDELLQMVSRCEIAVQVLGLRSPQRLPPRARKGGLTARGECMAEERHRFAVTLDGEGLQAPEVQQQVTGALTMAVNAKGCPSCAALGRRRRRTRVVWTLVEAPHG